MQLKPVQMEGWRVFTFLTEQPFYPFDIACHIVMNAMAAFLEVTSRHPGSAEKAQPHILFTRCKNFTISTGSWEKLVVPEFSLPSHGHLTTKCRLLAKWIKNLVILGRARQPVTDPSTASAVLSTPLILTQRMCADTSLLSHWSSVQEKSSFIWSKNFPPLPCLAFTNIQHSSMTVTPCYPHPSRRASNFPKCPMEWRCDNKHWHHLPFSIFLSRREDALQNHKGFLFILKAHANKNRTTVQLHWSANCVSIFLQAPYELNIK